MGEVAIVVVDKVVGDEVKSYLVDPSVVNVVEEVDINEGSGLVDPMEIYVTNEVVGVIDPVAVDDADKVAGAVDPMAVMK
ncbi:hypothetical protein EJD97_002759 [Solanum chilense]|uniref:Uncharacterized protein n=1 Tax=Solanum chilense TaxID=4083 RepID=A0A6N2BXG7_SOLCI|nr:hypothetical protein EJD97_002759 [Solanum chilense]